MDYLIDLRSDTVTKPCATMRNIMAQAEVGDDVYGEDPTINRLEKMVKELMGMDEALFVPSGTMANQLAVLAHTSRGDGIILEESSHIYAYEVGGIAVLSGVIPSIITGNRGKITPEQVKAMVKPPNIHYPANTLLSIENSHNFGGGIVTSQEELKKILEITKEAGIKVHIDGARIFNAAVSLDLPVKKVVEGADSVMFCLSKGLGAPVGSMLVGSGEFIERARKYRKMLGGGIRQGGILAAAGIYALENLVDRLAVDHSNALRLAQGLEKIPGVNLELEYVQTNIVIIEINQPGLDASELVNNLKTKGVLANAIDSKRVRFVTHREIEEKGIDETIKILQDLLG